MAARTDLASVEKNPDRYYKRVFDVGDGVAEEETLRVVDALSLPDGVCDALSLPDGVRDALPLLLPD